MPLPPLKVSYTRDTHKKLAQICFAVPGQSINTNISPSSDSTPQVGLLYIVKCTVSKFPGLTRTPTAQWLKVSMGTKRIGMPTPNEAALTLSPLKTSDAGRYRCQGNLSTIIHSLPLSNNTDLTLIAQSKSNLRRLHVYYHK